MYAHVHVHTHIHTHTHTQMPLVDNEERVVGVLLREVRDTGSYVKSYMVLDFSTHKLRLYPEDAEVGTVRYRQPFCLAM